MSILLKSPKLLLKVISLCVNLKQNKQTLWRSVVKGITLPEDLSSVHSILFGICGHLWLQIQGDLKFLHSIGTHTYSHAEPHMHTVNLKWNPIHKVFCWLYCQFCKEKSYTISIINWLTWNSSSSLKFNVSTSEDTVIFFDKIPHECSLVLFLIEFGYSLKTQKQGLYCPMSYHSYPPNSQQNGPFCSASTIQGIFLPSVPNSPTG